MTYRVTFFIVLLLFGWLIGGWLWGGWWLDWEALQQFRGILSSGKKDAYENIAIEFHGLIFDILFLGILGRI